MRGKRLNFKKQTSEFWSYHLMAAISLRFTFFIFIFGLPAVICIPGCKTDRVESLIAELKVKNTFDRSNAAEALGKIGDTRAVKPLVTALNDKDRDVRKSAADALDKLYWQAEGEKEKAAYLIAKSNWDEFVKIGKPAVEPLIAALKHKDYLYVRSNAAEVLGKIGDTRAVKPLIAALRSNADSVKRSAAEALGNIGDQRAIPILVTSLKKWHLGKQAANALEKIGWQPQSVRDKVHYAVAMRQTSVLTGMWEQTKSVLSKDLSSNDRRVTENAVRTFVALGKKDITPDLIKTLNSSKGNIAMAELYLNCGQKELYSAARAWAARHGFTITTVRGAEPTSWGSW